MIHHAKVPLKFWAEAINAAVCLHNRSPTTALKNKTPFECWFGKKPDVSNLRVFGCICFVYVPDKLRKKLDPKASKAIFMGYPQDTKGYKVYELSSDKFIRSRSVTFHEQSFYSFENKDKKLVLPEIYGSELDENEPHYEAEQVEDMPQADKEKEQVGGTYEEHFMKEVMNVNIKRSRKAPQRYDPSECLIIESLTKEVDEPMSLKEAMNSDHCGQWKEALKSEYDSLMQNNTWQLVPPPKDKNIAGSKWVLKVKRDANGNLDRFKARLVAQGYSQAQGVDYNEVFSPVARYSTLRTLIALANANDWEIHQMDVKTAFLNGSIDTEIYMSQPEGFVDNQHPEYICKLEKSIYGLKQSARCWNTTLDKFLISSGYQKSNADGCIYIKSTKKVDGTVSFVMLAVYVDDIMPLSNDVEMLKSEKANLCKRFKMVDQGEAHSILGMLIKRARAAKTLFINQPSYLQNILKRFWYGELQPHCYPSRSRKEIPKDC